MTKRPPVWTVIGLASWPVLLVLLFFTGNEPRNGQRWADANSGRGSLLAVTGMVWMTAVLLLGIWKLVFSVILPAMERVRSGRD